MPWPRFLRRAVGAACLAITTWSCSAASPRAPLTPLERNGYARVTSPAEISQDLHDLARRHTVAELMPLGRSALGHPMEALLLSKELGALQANPATPTRLTVMLLGSQHGTEPSGAEALLRLAHEVVEGRLGSYLDDMNLILVPDGNPDGRDRHRRVNGNGVNLSTNFTVLSEPETRAINDALIRWQPDVLLDVHESAVFKAKSLARQGYLTDVESQLEVANNPNLDPDIAAFSRDRLLRAVIELVTAQGLPAQHYIGEITDLRQPVTHGGVSLKNLRNKAGIMGVFSFLLENRLDPKTGDFPTPRNLQARVGKQLLGITAFLDVCRRHREDIRRLAAAARERWRAPPDEESLSLFSMYAPDPTRPNITVRLRRADTGEAEEMTFAYHGDIATAHRLRIPQAYVVTAHQDELRAWLDRQRIAYEVMAAPRAAAVTVQHIQSRTVVTERHGWSYAQYAIEERRADVQVEPGALWIPLDQPARRLIPLLLEPRSNSSIFEDPAYAKLIAVGGDFFIQRAEAENFSSALTSGLEKR